MHWRLLIEFSYDLYKTLCDIRLLSVLLTILVSGCHNTYIQPTLNVMSHVYKSYHVI